MKTKILLLFLFLYCFAKAQYTTLLDFNSANGQYPQGSLISDGTFLYGMTPDGGTNNMGVLFKIKPDGTGYSKLLDFNGTNGNAPFGSLISDGTFLYGMTSNGGTNNMGVLFKIKPDGTGYSKLLDFDGTGNGNTPYGSLVYDGVFLYGMTLGGGPNDMGTIFKIMPDGTGYTKLLDFVGVANGKWPQGSLIYDGTFLYGMTVYGGTNDLGVLFKIKPDGTGYSKLFDFDGASNGSYPYGSLIYDGVFLYGMTQGSGTYGYGIIFKIKPDGSGYIKLLDFSVTANGKWPQGSLISDGTFLYGMTHSGGTSTACKNSCGTIFKFGIEVGVVENNAKTDFTISPNPTSGIFTIQLAAGNWQLASSQKPEASIEIVNVLGEKIYSTQLPNYPITIDLSAQPSGIYFYKVKSADETIHTGKLIIE